MKFNLKYAAQITFHLGNWSKSFGWSGVDIDNTRSSRD